VDAMSSDVYEHAKGSSAFILIVVNWLLAHLSWLWGITMLLEIWLGAELRSEYGVGWGMKLPSV
jgi:hypothetical protein